MIVGRSLNSAHGNAHTTFHRALVGALVTGGHRVLFLEREDRASAEPQDLPPIGRADLARYGGMDDLERRFRDRVRNADAVLVASSMTGGSDLGHWVNDVAEGITVFLDIDAPATLRRLEADALPELERGLIRRYDVHLALAGGPALRTLEQTHGCGAARAFHPMVDTRELRPARAGSQRWDVGFLGARREEREERLEALLIEAARQDGGFTACVAGPGYPENGAWPVNVERLGHLPPAERARFYGAQRFALHVTNDEQAPGCWSPCVGLYEAAACGVPVISAPWDGMDYFFRPGAEILVAETSDDVLRIVHDTDASEARMIGQRARRRVLSRDTAEHRVSQLEQHLRDARSRPRAPDRPRPKSKSRPRPMNGKHAPLRPGA
ncbi:MAG TPA: glycosyltransferase [Longimicrobiales bacterium]|nr:glycosyltransferase [Longimicrobiales bacterium]